MDIRFSLPVLPQIKHLDQSIKPPEAKPPEAMWVWCPSTCNQYSLKKISHIEMYVSQKIKKRANISFEEHYMAPQKPPIFKSQAKNEAATHPNMQ